MNTDGDYSMPLKEAPASIDAERGLLGSWLLDPAAIDEAAAVLEPGDFWRAAHEAIWRVLLDLRDSGADVNLITLRDRMGARYDAIRGDDLMYEIRQATPHAANAHVFAAIVRQKAMLRRLIGASNEAIRDCYANELPAAEVLAAAESRVFAISEREATGNTEEASDLMDRAWIEIVGREPGEPRGVLTGIDDLDFMTDGFKPQDMIVVAARPSMGKTAFATMLATAAAGHGIRVLFVSLEMSRDALGERLLSCEAALPGELLRRSWGMSDDQRERLAAAYHRLRGLPISIEDRPGRSVSQIAANARRIRSRCGLGLVVIDYLSLIEGNRQRGENRQEEVARISRSLKRMARELACPVVVLHQLNRQSENRDGHRPRLSDLRESGQIEQDADQVLLLHRPEYYDANDQPGIAEVIVAKNRNGPTGACRIAFNRFCTRFEPLSSAGPNY